MRLCYSPKFLSASAILAVVATAGAQTAQVHTAARPTVRITAKVDNAVRTQLPGTHPAIVDRSVIGGRVAASKQLQHLRLVLASSDEQEAALQQLMAEQQDKTSANYHKWLTPESFGTYFGPAQADIAKVTAWLGDQGFSVESVASSGRVITFNGTVGQVESAFQTEIHSVQINGEAHAANTTDITIPSALSSVVRGVARLSDIQPKHVGSMEHASTVQLDGASTVGTPTPLLGNNGPNYGFGSGTHYITPGDAATIFNTVPLSGQVAAGGVPSGGTGIDGTGQTISILAQTNIDIADVQKFRSMFGLKKNDPVIVYVDQDPGLNQDDGEAFLDAEWGGALAPGATVDFIVSSPNYFSGGIDSSALYAVENNIGDIISLSYGGCESGNGATYTAYWNSLWEQAAAQGQTALVSSGDSGAAGCDSSSSSYAVNGYGVNALGSSAYNVAVGGSIFVDFVPANYWGVSGTNAIPFNTALSYVPEAALNQSRLAPTYLNTASTAYQTGSGIFAGGGGISIFTSRPAWQTGSGIPTTTDTINLYSGSPNTTGMPTGYVSDGTHRLVPDIVNIAANGHDGTLYCASSLCSTNGTALNNAGVVGGTSVATPTQAGIQALVNQKNGGRQGNVLPIYYKLAAMDYAAGNCQASLGSASAAATLPASTCNFHDVVGGSITVPSAASGTAGYGFLAGVGFDEASGLGSVNATNVANNFASVSLVATKVSLLLSPAAGITHGTAQNLSITVAPTSSTGTPTGDVSLIAETSTPNGPRVYKLASGAYTGPVGNTVSVDGYGDTVTSALPAGSYNVHAHYAGDGTYAPSDSTSVPVSIAKENAAISSTSSGVNNTGGNSATSTFSYGGPAVYLATSVSATSSAGVPTGTVTYSISRNGSSLAPLTVNVDGAGNTYFYAGLSYPTYYLRANYAQLAPGSYVVTVAYSGDKTFNATSTTNTFTVAQATPAATLSAPASITSGASTILGFSVALPTIATAPNPTVVYATGTVTFTDSTTSSSLGSCTLTSGSCTVTTTSITTAGNNTVTALYSGDTNYMTATVNATTTVGSLTPSTLTLTTSGTYTVGYQQALKATLSPTAATGTASFYDGATYLGACTLSSGVCTLSIGSSPTTAPSTGGILTAGSHSFSAVYSGDTTYVSATGTLTATVAKSTTTVTFSAPANSTYGQPVVVSAYITRSSNSYAAPAIPLTGTLSIMDSVTGNVVGTGTPVYDPGGYHYYQANVTVTNLTGGAHTLTAVYSGDANFNGSTGALTPSATVAALTPTIILSTTTGATVYGTGSPVLFRAVIPASSSLAAPSGTVTLTDTTTTATYSASAFTYSASLGGFVSTLGLGGLTGTHTFTLSLAADGNYNAAVSNTLGVLVTTNNVWVANGNGTVSGLTESGAAVTSSGQSGGGVAVAIDNAGDVWSLNKSGSAVSEYTNAGALISAGGTVGGLSNPTALAIDGSGLVWVTNTTGTLSVLSAPNTAVSSVAYKVNASTPTSINIDPAGNLWITNSGDNSVTEVIGAATPVMTPTTTAVKSNTLAAKP